MIQPRLPGRMSHRWPGAEEVEVLNKDACLRLGEVTGAAEGELLPDAQWQPRPFAF